jgi:hypothetical protein
VVDGDQGPGDRLGGQGGGDLLQPALRISGPGPGGRQPGPHPGDQVREQVSGVGDLGRGGMAAVAQLDRRLRVAAEQGRLGQPPQGRRQALELGHPLPLGQGVAEQSGGLLPVASAHGQIPEDVLGGDPGGDPAAAVDQGLAAVRSASAQSPPAHWTWARWAAM